MLAQQNSDSEANAVCSIDNASQDKVIQLVYRHSGIHLAELTCQFVETRPKRRMRARGMSDSKLYLDYVDSHPDEAEHLVNAFTTNETCFFRTRPLWDFFRDSFFPELMERGNQRAPSFWSAACSSGEEAYSLAMLSEEVFPKRATGPKARVLATDISTDILEKAKAARYSGRNIIRLRTAHSDMLDRYFERDGQDHVLSDAVRKSVQFKRHNLMQATGVRDTYDLVMLRNVLIYFSQADQIKIVDNIVSAMRPGGILAIGESESLGFFESGLDFVRPFVYRKP
ncbi:MAG: protein-glutamate O-methyltransferase CheR [Pseudomonadota bacterium]